ncbi:MAG TPA: hypothetical protein VFU73_10085 [Actinocrinis sp.]|nr:hypothetical protein [Actinocrinis sp.]
MTTGGALPDVLLDDPSIGLAEIRGRIAELEAEQRVRGASPRRAHQARHLVARHLGDVATARRELELWLAAPRDRGCDCAACERRVIGSWHAESGDDGRAYEAWSPVLDGELFCGAEPHGVLAGSLIPLIRLGMADRARANHLRGYRVSRRKEPMAAGVGGHLEFCALTGNAARGLELLAEHGDWLAPDRPGPANPEFLAGAEVLLRILGDAGHDDLPFALPGGDRTGVGALRERVGAELNDIAARFDERNGNDAYSTRLLQRRSRQPFLSSLPLPARTTLPKARRTPIPPPAPKPASLDELTAEARRLTLHWHPDATAAWQRVGAAAAVPGAPVLPEDVRAELDEQLVADAAPGDPTHPDSDDAASDDAASDSTVRLRRMDEIADRYETLGALGSALRVRSRAATVRFREQGGTDLAGALAEQTKLRTTAAEALADGRISAREYMAVRLGSGYLKYNAWTTLAFEQPRDEPRTAAASRDALAELLDLVEECRRLAAWLHGAVAAGMASDLRLAADESDEAEGLLRLAADWYAAGGSPWSAASCELNLSQIARNRGDLPEAERLARLAVEHNLDPYLRGPAAMMLADAIWFQDGREGEAVAPALAAAESFGVLEGGAEDEARARLRAAEALTVVGRHEEAVGLFEPALAVLEGHWSEEQWKPLIAQAARAYGNCLLAVGDPRRAAELLLATADRVKDWPNQAPHAMIASDAAAALERAGQSSDAALAFQRAAHIWGGLGEPIVRIKCLRSAAWLRADEDLVAALALMDEAGGELVGAIGGAAEPADRTEARFELAETHVQRARVVLDLAEAGTLPEDRAAGLVREAFQEVVAAVNGLRRMLAAVSADRDTEPDGTHHGTDTQHGSNTEHSDTAQTDTAQTDTDQTGTDQTDTAPGDDEAADADAVLPRLVQAAMISAQLEAGHLGRAKRAAFRLEQLAGECAAHGDSEAAAQLTEHAARLNG